MMGNFPHQTKEKKLEERIINKKNLMVISQGL